MKPEIKLAEPQDTSEIYEIFKQTWLTTYPNAKHKITTGDVLSRYPDIDREETINRYAETYEHMHKNYGTWPIIVWVAKEDGKAVGLVTVNRGDPMKIGAIYVLPEHQRKGIGTRLFQHALDFIGVGTITIMVATYNTNAIRFYERFGFINKGETKDPSGVLPNGTVIPEIMMVKEVKLKETRDERNN